MKRGVVWFKALFHWFFKEFRLALIALLVLVIAAFFVFRSGASESLIRITGLVLQLLGLSTVVYGIRETRKLFGRPSLLQLLREKASRFPRWRRDAVVGTFTGAVTATMGSASAYGWHTSDPAAPIEARLNALTRNVERMNERLIQMQKDSDSELRKHSESLRRERQFREEGDEHLHKRLEVAETGGLHISLIGVIWIFLGLVLSTVSPEIAQWMR